MNRRVMTIAAAAALLATGFAASVDARSKDGASGKSSSRLEKTFGRFDRNHDGVVERSEIETVRERGFRRLDPDGDRVVDSDELSRLIERRKEKKGEKGAKRFEKMMRSVDRDGDGRITEDEFVAKTPRWFSRADEDRDGRLLRQEFDDFAAKREARRSRRGGSDG